MFVFINNFVMVCFSDVRTTTECVNRNSYNCSAYEMKQITGFMEMTWMNVLKVCPEKDIVAEAYSKGSCSAPPTCSLTEAYNCSLRYDSSDCRLVANFIDLFIVDLTKINSGFSFN